MPNEINPDMKAAEQRARSVAKEYWNHYHGYNRIENEQNLARIITKFSASENTRLLAERDAARERVKELEAAKPSGFKEMAEWRQQWDMLCESSVRETKQSRASENRGLINHLAHEIWTRWHGPLARIPGTHEETVESLANMFDDYED